MQDTPNMGREGQLRQKCNGPSVGIKTRRALTVEINLIRMQNSRLPETLHFCVQCLTTFLSFFIL